MKEDIVIIVSLFFWLFVFTKLDYHIDATYKGKGQTQTYILARVASLLAFTVFYLATCFAILGRI